MSGEITREPHAATEDVFDLIVVGGGIYGVCLALEAARRGLKPLLLEKGDFGEATSWNTLRIIHGGLRYLQNLDLRRFAVSANERRWFLREFPDLVQPLPCLMPLYGKGLRRPIFLRAALRLNDVLSCRRNHEVKRNRRIPASRILNSEQTVNMIPAAETDGLRGAALWHDALMPNPQRLLIELLRWASHCGAVALNYVAASQLVVKNNLVAGLEAHDHETDKSLRFRAPVVVNCSGPWCQEVAEQFGLKAERLFYPSIAFNLLLKRDPVSRMAVAVSPEKAGGQTFFLIPMMGYTLAGTYHANWANQGDHPIPTNRQIDACLDRLNLSFPSLRLQRRDVVRVYAGCLPAVAADSHFQARRPAIVDHGKHGGPCGAISVSGVKFTTARLVAEKTLRRVVDSTGKRFPPYGSAGRPGRNFELEVSDFPDAYFDNKSSFADQVRRLAESESVIHLEDLLLRRTNWGERFGDLPRIIELVCESLGWEEARKKSEIQRFAKATSDPFSGAVQESTLVQ
jgi:glycerol-3-phosphate dehydrogenase